ALGDLVIEGHRADLAGEGVRQALAATLPGTAQRWQLEDLARLYAIQLQGFQRRLFRQRQSGLDRLEDVLRREMKVLASLEQTLVQLGHALVDVLFAADEAARVGDLRFGHAGVQLTQGSFDQSGHLRSDHRVHATHVCTHGVELAQRAQDVLLVATDRFGVLARVDRMPNQHLALALTMAIDTTVALLHDVGVIGDLQMDEEVTVVLELDTVRRAIRGQQYTD